VSARRSCLAAVMSVLVAAAGLTVCAPAGPAGAAPAFIDADTTLRTSAGGGGGTIGPSCLTTNTSSPQAFGPVPENGGPVTQTATGSTAVTYGGNPIGSMSLSATARAALTSVGGVPRTISLQFSAQGSSTVVTRPDCIPNVQASSRLSYHFLLPVSGVLEVTTSNTRGAGGQLSIGRTTAGPLDGYYDQTYTFPADQVARVFLPAGEYDGHLLGVFGLSADLPAVNAGSFSAVATFTPAGAQTRTASGKATKYVTLPGAVTCTTGQLTPAATAKKARVGKVKQIVYYVDDQKVKKVKHPKKGEVTSLPVAGTSPSTVRAVVTLEPKGKGKGKKPKTVEATASYEACS